MTVRCLRGVLPVPSPGGGLAGEGDGCKIGCPEVNAMGDMAAAGAIPASPPCAMCVKRGTGTGTGPNAMTPLGSIGAGWLGASCWPPTQVPLVEP